MAVEHPQEQSAVVRSIEWLGALAIAAGLSLAAAAVAHAEPTDSSDSSSAVSSESASDSGDSDASAVSSQPQATVRGSGGAPTSDVTESVDETSATDPSNSETATTQRRSSPLSRDASTPWTRISALSITSSTRGDDLAAPAEEDSQSTDAPRLSAPTSTESVRPPRPSETVSTPLASVEPASQAVDGPTAPAHPQVLVTLWGWVRRQVHDTLFNESPTVSYDSTRTIQVLDGTITGALDITDPDEDRVKLTVTRKPKHGTVIVAPDGTFTYTPDVGYAGPDTFTVRATDHTGSLVHRLLRLVVPSFHTGSTRVELTVAQVETIQVGDKPAGIAIAPRAPRVYVTNNGTDTVSVIDTTTNTVIGTIEVADGPIAVVLGLGGDIAYVGSQTGCSDCTGNTVSVIDVFNDANDLITTIDVPPVPQSLAVSPDGTQVYVASVGETLTVIDGNSNEVTASIHLPTGLQAVAVSPDGSRVYVAGFVGNSGAVYVIDTATNEVVTEIPVGVLANGVAVTPDGSHVYVTNAVTAEDNTVSVIDTATNTVVTSIDVGQGPEGVAVSADGTRVYVANFTDNTVSVIDTATNTVVTTIGVGTSPAELAVSPDGTRVYVTNFNANTVSVITLN